MDKVTLGKVEFNQAEWQNVSSEAQRLIKKMMEYDPNQRYSAQQALNDPWFKMLLGDTAIDRPLTLSALTNLKHFRVRNITLREDL